MASIQRALALFAARRPGVATILPRPASLALGDNSSQPFSLRTAFAVEVTVNQDAIEGEITIDTIPEQRSTVQQSAAKSERYQIMSEYGTSFLWKKLSEHGRMHVDDATKLFPRTTPFFEDWVKVYETLFEANELHLGSGKDLFSTVEEEVCWEVEGALLALALLFERPSVASVEFVSSVIGEKRYTFARQSAKETLRTFLLDMASLLPRFAPHTPFKRVVTDESSATD
jgi:hypothetical protein